jgi:prolyl 4-hydroxylase
MKSAVQSLPDADAVHYRAVKTAEGIHVPQDWNAALDHLQDAAELGSVLAQAELAGLTGHWKMAQAILAGRAATTPWRTQLRNAIDPTRWPRPGRSQWSRFRKAVDLEKWLTISGPAALVSEAPRMGILRDIATPEVCDWLIARSRPRLQRAKVYGFDGKNAEVRYVDDRTNSDCSFAGPERDFFMAILRARIAEAMQMRVNAMEAPEILHYSVGQEFKRHYDSNPDPDAPGVRQRVITVLLSLNDDYDGGATEFPLAGGQWRGHKGTAIYFWNVGPDGGRDKRSLHAGLPVTRGEKWLLTQFIGRPRDMNVTSKKQKAST